MMELAIGASLGIGLVAVCTRLYDKYQEKKYLRELKKREEAI
jgi:hypothetical protein